MKKNIMLGLIGTIGAGKTTVSDYLVSKGFERITMGDLVRLKAKEEGLEPTRDNLQSLQEKYRTKFGKDYFIKEAIRKLKESEKFLSLIDGIRTPIDAKAAKLEKAILILVDASPPIRFERLKSRKRTGDPQTFEEFKKQEEAEFKLFDFITTLKYVDFKLDNSGSQKEIYKKVEDLIANIM
ncbi:MAG: AAA family ATPase [archaeon]